MSTVLVLSDEPGGSGAVLPALELLGHAVSLAPADPAVLSHAPVVDVIVVDGRHDLPKVKSLCRMISLADGAYRVVLVLNEGGLVAVTPEWNVADVVLSSAGPAEVDARIRLAVGSASAQSDSVHAHQIRGGTIIIDEHSYSARLKNQPLDLTFKEFELLKYLMSHPGRVFTRSQLLQEVWGYDYYGGTRTVDVHVRRLRAKLGPENESLIGTVRNVGYRFVVGSEAVDAESYDAGSGTTVGVDD